LSDEVLLSLKRRASGHGRSLQQELRLLLEHLVSEYDEGLDPLAAARELRERLRASGRVFSDSTQIIREDRDSR
jgi:plasmid stability protein